MDGIKLLRLINDVFGKTTILSYASRVEVFAEKRFAAATVETVATLWYRLSWCDEWSDNVTYGNPDICNAAITDLESFNVLAHLNYLPNGFMAWDKLVNVALDLMSNMIMINCTGNLEINSPSWICPSVPQTPQQLTTFVRLLTSNCGGENNYLWAAHRHLRTWEWVHLW